MSKAGKPADWTKWGRTSEWSHLEAACLCVGFEPVAPESAAAEIIRSKQSPGPESSLLRERARYHDIRSSFLTDAPIDRITFVHWAVQASYVNLPAEMVAMLGDDLHLPYFSIKQVVDAVAGQEGWHEDARKALLDQMLRGAGNDSLLPCSLANYRLDDDPGSWHLLDPEDVSPWLLKWRGIVWPQPKAKQDTVSPIPLQRQRAQEQAILRTLDKLGFDPLAVPRAPAGKASEAKGKARGELTYTKDVFDKAWQRLRTNKEIGDG